MWKNQMWSIKTRWIVTIAFAVIIIANPGKNSSKSSYASSSKCMMDGCESDGQGWYNNRKNPELAKAGLYGAYKTSDRGGYCSKDHAADD